MTVRAITFDLWGTLIRDQDADARHLLRVDSFVRVSHCPAAVVDEALKKVHEEFFRIHVEEQRTLVPGDWVRMLCDALDVKLDPGLAARVALDFGKAILIHPPAPVEGALEAVRQAAELYPVGLICDSGISPGASLRPILKSFGFLDYLKVLTFSDEIGVAKPQAPMFTTTAARLGVQPHELLHIGDLEPTDIAGVHGVGGVATLFTAVNQRFQKSTTAEFVLASWAEFPELLLRLPEFS